MGRKSLQRKEPRHGRPNGVPLLPGCCRACSAPDPSWRTRSPSPATSPAISVFTRARPTPVCRSSRTACTDLTPSLSTSPMDDPLAASFSGGTSRTSALDYNAATDTMYVGVNTYGVAGNVDGTGRLRPAPPATDPANFGGDKSMAVGFAPLTGTYNPSNLPAADHRRGHFHVSRRQRGGGRGTGLDGFTVTKYAGGTVPGTIEPVDRFRSNAHGGHGQSRLQSQHGDARLRVHDHQFQQTPGRQPRQRRWWS